LSESIFFFSCFLFLFYTSLSLSLSFSFTHTNTNKQTYTPSFLLSLHQWFSTLKALGPTRDKYKLFCGPQVGRVRYTALHHYLTLSLTHLLTHRLFLFLYFTLSPLTNTTSLSISSLSFILYHSLSLFFSSLSLSRISLKNCQKFANYCPRNCFKILLANKVTFIVTKIVYPPFNMHCD